jgi:hypothetical protein
MVLDIANIDLALNTFLHSRPTQNFPNPVSLGIVESEQRKSDKPEHNFEAWASARQYALVSINNSIFIFRKAENNIGELLVIEHMRHIHNISVWPLASPDIGAVNCDVIEAIVMNIAPSKDIEPALVLRVGTEVPRLKPLMLCF